MIIILIENDLFSLGGKSLTKEVQSKFPRTSTVELNNRNVLEVIDTINSSKPLLTSKWLINANNLKSDSLLKVIDKLNDNVLIARYQKRTNDVDDSMKILKSKNVKFSLIDSFNLSEEKLISYVSEELSISEYDSKTLVTRCNGYLPYINESVFALKSLNRSVTRKDILNFVVKRSSFNSLTLFYHIIGYKRVSSEVVSRFIYDFRYAFRWMKSDLLTKLEDAILIYSLMNDGVLSPRNYKEFTYPRKLKISDYLLKSLVIDVYKSVSIETLVFTKLSIEKMRHTYELLEICTN